MAKLTLYVHLVAEREEDDFSELDTSGEILGIEHHCFESPVTASKLFAQIQRLVARAAE